MSDGKSSGRIENGGASAATASEDTATQRVSTEGADMLSLAGVNDANLLELSRLFGVKVSLRGDTLVISGAQEFVQRLLDTKTPFLFLTNNAAETPFDLRLKLEGLGIHGVTEENFITSSMATAMFLRNQKEGARVYVMGRGALTQLYAAALTQLGRPNRQVDGEDAFLAGTNAIVERLS